MRRAGEVTFGVRRGGTFGGGSQMTFGGSSQVTFGGWLSGDTHDVGVSEKSTKVERGYQNCVFSFILVTSFENEGPMPYLADSTTNT